MSKARRKRDRLARARRIKQNNHVIDNKVEEEFRKRSGYYTDIIPPQQALNRLKDVSPGANLNPIEIPENSSIDIIEKLQTAFEEVLGVPFPLNQFR